MSAENINFVGVGTQAILMSNDIHTMMQMVQTVRTQLIDKAMVGQVEVVRMRNEQIEKLAYVMSSLNLYKAQIPYNRPGSTPRNWDVNDIKNTKLRLRMLLRMPAYPI